MKPSKRRLLASLQKKYEQTSEEKKEQVRAFAKSYNLAKAFRGDKVLSKWWDEHCKGKDIHEVQGILQRGVDAHEITFEQGLLVLDFLTARGYLSE